MHLTEEEIKIIKQTWRVLRQIDPQVLADAFYSRLFYENPSVRPMFPKSMTQQYNKVIDMVSYIIGRLHDVDSIMNELKELAIRHVYYGTQPEQYRAVGNALLWTLEQGLGDDWTEERKNAWTKAYQLTAYIMIEAHKAHIQQKS